MIGDPARMTIAEGIFSAATVEYMRRKNRGGANGKKGTRYEDFFAAATLAKLASKYLSCTSDNWPTVKEQVDVAFVDDVVVCETDATTHHQCKDVQSASWNAGDHPISSDFESQIELCEKSGDPGPLMKLVVSNEDLADGLRKSIPQQLQKKTEVLHFPVVSSVNVLIQEDENLQHCLSGLTRVEDPSLDEMELAFKAMLSAWIHVKKEVDLHDFMIAAGKDSPKLLRLFPITPTGTVPTELNTALAQIAGLTYHVKRGIFGWNYSSRRTSAIFPADCESEEFKRFVNRIVKRSPTCFEDFWEEWP